MKRRSFQLVRCYWCGNPSMPTQPLVWGDIDVPGEDDRPIHVQGPCADARDPKGVVKWNGDLPVCGHDECAVEDGDRDCPPLPTGWATCWECGRAAPDDALLVAMMVTDHKDGTVTTFDREPFYVCLGKCLMPNERGFDTGGLVLHARHPIHGHQHPTLERPKKARDAPTRREDGQQERSLADRARADAVTTDGDGMSVADLATLWGVSYRGAQKVVARLLDGGLLRYEEVPTRAGGTSRKVYWRVEE